LRLEAERLLSIWSMCSLTADKMPSLNEIEIREVEIDDAESIAKLSDELGYPSSLEQLVSRLKAVLPMPGHKVYAATTGDGSVIGWVHVFTTPYLESEPFAQLGGLVVTAGQRGRGVGKRLLAKAESWALQNGLNRMRIRSRSTREEAHAFYERLGYGWNKTQHVFDKALNHGKQ
jgi:GNAT superfamily N-acetyltransferase